MNITEKSKYPILYGWCLVYKGWYYHISSNYGKAIEFRLEANEIFLKYDCLDGKMAVCNSLLGDYSRIGNLDLAIEYGLIGIELAEKDGREDKLMAFMINTSIAYVESKKYDKARNLLQKIKKFYINIPKRILLSYYVTLAEVEIYYNNKNEAYKCCEKAYELVRQLEYLVYECEVLSIRAEVNYKLGRDKEALEDFENAIKSSRDFNNTLFVVKTLKRMAKYYYSKNNFKMVEQKYLEALYEASKINSQIDKSEICYELSEFYSEIGNIENAYKYLKKHNILEKEIFSNESSSWFARLHNKEITREAKIYKQLYQDVDLISEIGKKLTSDLRIEKNLKVIYDEVRELMQSDIFGIASYDEDEEVLNYDLFIVDGEKSNYGKFSIHKETLGTWCFKNRENIFINDFEKEYKNYISYRSLKVLRNYKNNKINSVMFCPLVMQNKVIGIICVQSYKKNAYDKGDMKKLEILTSYIAIALENAKLFNNIEYSATHDALTNIYNRKEILNKGEKLIKNREACSVILIDIDYFKIINDKYGHIAGDKALKSITNVMKSVIKNKGYIGRYGGEEFLIIICDNNIENVTKLAEYLRRRVESESICIDALEIKVTASFGVYSFTNKINEFYEGIKFADSALYRAKFLGRNKVISYDNILS